jgi:macrolide transport system ATP-binding/permease protein
MHIHRRSHFDALAQDSRHALRLVWKSPAITIVIAITLALGIGANAAIFSVVNGSLLRPLPVRSPNEIVVLAINDKNAPVGSSGFSYPEFSDFRSQAGAFSDVFANAITSVQVTVSDRSENAFGVYVSGNCFSALGVKPALGALIRPGESENLNAPNEIVLGYSYWQKRFGGDPAIVGKQVLINAHPATVLGVADKSFHGMFSIFEMDVYLPISAMTLEVPPNFLYNSRDSRRFLVFGRLKPGVTIAQAQSSIDVVTARLAAEYPATDKWSTVTVIPEKNSRPIPYANNSFVAIAALFLVLSAFILLLACLNIENILLARGTARRREMGIRAALGASRARLIRQLLTETMLLSLLGALLGIFLGFGGARLIGQIRIQGFPLRLDTAFDARVFLYALAAALCTGLLVGLLPAFNAGGTDVNSVLHEGGQGSQSSAGRPAARNFLVFAQVAASLMLLVVAGLFVRSLQNVRNFAVGFDSSRILNVRFDPAQNGFTPAQTDAFYRDLESRVAAIPGVESASLASYVPMAGFPSRLPVFLEKNPAQSGEQPPKILMNAVDAPYFRTLGISLLRGRALSASDDSSAPLVAVINRTMASQLWPGVDPIGQRFSAEKSTGPFIEVVGIVADGKYQTLAEDPQPFFYVPLAQNFSSRRTLQIRTASQQSLAPALRDATSATNDKRLIAPESLAPAIREIVTSLAPSVAILDLETMDQTLAGALGSFTFRLAAQLASVLGAIGLVLAVVGIYGVVSFAAAQRTREIGIRMALGATPRDVLALIWRHGIRLILAGVAAGMLGAFALARSISHLLVGVSPSDPITYTAVAALLAVIGLAACWLPARRAMRLDPLSALRHE